MPPSAMPKILCIANQKGGVGKTTTAVNLAAGLARRGYRTLLVDLDIQGSATATLIGPLMPGERSIAECLVDEKPFDDVVRPTSIENMRLAPAGEMLAFVDVHLATALGRERVLERCLQGGQLAAGLDIIIVDTAPYLGLLTINALVAADYVLVPVSCEYLPLLGLKLFNETLTRLRERLGTRAAILGYLTTMIDRRESITTEVEALLRRTFGERVFEGGIRVNTKHKASPSHRKTIFEYEGPSGRGRADYERLTDEVIERAQLPAPAQRAAPGAKGKKKAGSTSTPSASSRGGAASAPRASSSSS